MKKTYWLLTFVSLTLFVACQSSDPTTTSSFSSELQPSSSSVVSDDNEKVFALIDAFSTYYTERKNVTITKDGAIYYNENHNISIDTDHYIRYEYQYKSGYNSLDVRDGVYEITEEKYYNGEYEFFLEDDDCWYRRENTAEKAELLTSPFDLSPIRHGAEIENVKFDIVLKKNLDGGEIDTYFRKNITGLSNFLLTVTCNSEYLTDINYSYSQNGFEVSVDYEFGFSSANLSLPLNYSVLS